MEKEYNLTSFMDQFLKFETTHKLFELEIDGVCPWHIIRFNVYSTLLNSKYNLGEAQSPANNESFIKRILNKVMDLPDVIKYNVLTYQKEKDVLIFNHQRKVKNDEYYECLYTDSISEELLTSHIIVEDPYMDGHLKPVKNKSIQYTDVIFFLTTLKRLCKPEKKIEDDYKIDKLIKDIVFYFKINIDSEQMHKEIEKRIFMYQTMYKYYEKMVENINPKVIVQVVSYSTNKMIVNSIAKKRGIPTIELQHGTMGKYHIAYNFAEKMELECFPDFIFTFGQFWKDNTRLPISKDKIKVVGWPYYENKVKQFKSQTNHSNKQTILFVSQGTIGNKLSEIAARLYKIIDKDKYQIIYKLHPGEYTRWQEEYPWLIDSGLEIIDTNDHDMHYYFAQADIQIGVYSTALFEGLGYGLKTFICKLPSFEYMEELINNGIAKLVENEIEIKEAISQDKISKSNSKIGYFWKEDSLNSMLQGIDEVINSNKQI